MRASWTMWFIVNNEDQFTGMIFYGWGDPYGIHYFVASAIASISTAAPFGSAAAWMVERAGGVPLKIPRILHSYG